MQVFRPGPRLSTIGSGEGHKSYRQYLVFNYFSGVCAGNHRQVLRLAGGAEGKHQLGTRLELAYQSGLRRWRGCGNDRKSSADPSSPSRPPEISSLFVKLSVSERTVEPYPGFVQPSPPEVPDKEPWNGISSAGRLGP